jgi:beta-glucanase (GH16 family)
MMPDRGLDFKSNGRRSTYELHSNGGSLGKGMEIDIMEHLTKWKANEMHYAAHWDGFREDLKSFSNGYELQTKPDDYITFALEWAPNLFVWYADGREIARLASERVADVPLYLIFSTNMGGWAGDIKSKQLPDYTYIDYVRVWALDDESNAKIASQIKL